MPHRYMASLVLFATTPGCAGDKGDDSSPDTATEDCSGFEGTISADLVAATPRDGDVNIEGLALCMSDWGVAWPDVYDRVSVDIPATWAAWPDLASIEYRFLDSPYEFSFHADDATWGEMVAGTYHAWDCVNAWYSLRRVDVDDSDTGGSRFGALVFKGIYDMTYISLDYQDLPGIQQVQLAGRASDSSTIWGLIDDDGTYQYLFDLGEGDCPSGCTSHTYTWISSSSPGALTREATWAWDSGTFDEEPPNWVTAYHHCGNESLDGD